MLPVRVMQIIVDADDSGRPTIADELIKEWNHDIGSLKFRQVSSNFLFSFYDRKRQFVLRISHDSRRSRSLLKSELDFMDHLRKSGLKIPEVIKSKNNREIEVRETPDGTFFAIVFEFIKGSYIKYTQMIDSEIYEWGRQIALVHQASQNYLPLTDYRRYSVRDEIEQELPFLSNNSELQQLLKEIAIQLGDLPQTSSTFGLIHYDLEEDNLLWMDDRSEEPYIIDFDDSAYHFYMADIVFALEEVRELSALRAIHFVQQFLIGYTSIHEIPAVTDWKREFKLFNLLMDLMKTARTIHAYYQTDQKQDSEWLAKMRKRHMNSINDMKDRFNNEWNSVEKYYKSLNWVDQVNI